MKNFATFEQAKMLSEKGIDFGSPRFGDLFYTIHPDTGQIDNVLVGSAKWHISALLPMLRAPSLQDLMEVIGVTFSIRYNKNDGYWIIEKTNTVDSIAHAVDYMVITYPLRYNKCPITLIVDLICE